MHPTTHLISDSGQFEDPHGAVVPPVYQTSLFTFDSYEALEAAFESPRDAHIYSRGNNPTVRLAERKIAALCGADDARLFASGMAAVAAVVLHCVSRGGHVVLVRGAYGPTRTLFHDFVAPKFGVDITEVDGRDPRDFAEAIRDDTQLVYLESPTSTLFAMQDLRAVAEIAKSRGAATAVDNSWATPLFQKPLHCGIDYEIHSATKYLGGHSDVLGGAVAGSADRMRRLVFEYLHLGATMAPHAASLLLRGLRTLPLRMRQHQESAAEVARFLDTHPKVAEVRWPGLPHYPQADLAAKQLTGFGGLLSFRLKSDREADVRSFANALRLFRLGVSWGGHESLAFIPAVAYSREHPPERLAASGITPTDVRLSVGLEDVGDLIEDLRTSLAAP